MRKKKLLSAFIAAVMAFVFIPTSVFADNAEKDPAVIEAEQKIAAGQAVKYDSKEEANAMKVYLESKGYTNVQVQYNNPVIQVGVPIHWMVNVYNPAEFAVISYAIDRNADFIVLTDYSLFSNSTVWVVPLRKDSVLTGDMIEEILKKSHLTSSDGYDFSSFKGDEVTYFTEQDRTLVTDSPQAINLKHEMTSTDRIGWVKRIKVPEGPGVDFDWDCYFANEHALDYWGGDTGGYHGIITDDMCLIHSTSESNRPYTYSTGRINWDMPEFGYFVSATAPESPEPGDDPAEPEDGPTGDDPAEPDDGPTEEDPDKPEDGPTEGDPVEPEDGPTEGDPVEPEDGPTGDDPAEPDDGPTEEDPDKPDDGPTEEDPDKPEDGPTEGDPVEPDDKEDPEDELTPKTGDTFNFGVLLVLMCTSGAGALAIIRKKKDK